MESAAPRRTLRIDLPRNRMISSELANIAIRRTTRSPNGHRARSHAQAPRRIASRPVRKKPLSCVKRLMNSTVSRPLLVLFVACLAELLSPVLAAAEASGHVGAQGTVG